MEMSKSPKPRHFSDSSRERWDKNRHEQRTKSYLKRKKKRKRSEEKFRDVCACVACHGNDVERPRKRASMWDGGAAGVMGFSLFVCARKSHH